MQKFSYDEPAELFIRRRTGPRNSLSHRRFASTAAALQFAVEVVPTKSSIVLLETGEHRLEGAALLAKYDAADYPLPRASQLVAISTAAR